MDGAYSVQRMPFVFIVHMFMVPDLWPGLGYRAGIDCTVKATGWRDTPGPGALSWGGISIEARGHRVRPLGP